MPDLVEVLVEDDRWRTLDLVSLADRAARAALAEVGLAAEGFLISVMAGDDARIAALNADFRGKPRPTNVLSWPSEERGAPGGMPEPPEAGTDDDPEELGDIALAWETCAAEAEEAGKPLADHLAHLMIHAVLHLLGYDHIRDDDAELMEGTEIRALARLGLSDPY